MAGAPQAQNLTTSLNLNSMDRRDEPQRVFVYGTLKKGFNNHERLLKDCKFLGVAYIDGLLFHLGAFPALHLGERFCKVHGEVYEVDWDKLMGLDRLEGVANDFYSRIEVRVAPQGKVWTYIFPYRRAVMEDKVVPSGFWRGSGTPSVKWLGFGRGVEVGSFETNPNSGTIKVGSGDGHWELRRSQMDNSYKLIDNRSGQVLGSYENLQDLLSTDPKTKPLIRLPGIIRRPPEAPLLPPNPVQQHPNLPIIWSPDSEKEEKEPVEPPIPQAARLLGLKYGAA